MLFSMTLAPRLEAGKNYAFVANKTTIKIKATNRKVARVSAASAVLFPPDA